MKDRRGCRTRDPELCALAQHSASARLSQRPTAHRVRSRVLRYETDRPTPGRNPIARASTGTRAFQLRAVVVCCGSATRRSVTAAGHVGLGALTEAGDTKLGRAADAATRPRRSPKILLVRKVMVGRGWLG